VALEDHLRAVAAELAARRCGHSGTDAEPALLSGLSDDAKVLLASISALVTAPSSSKSSPASQLQRSQQHDDISTPNNASAAFAAVMATPVALSNSTGNLPRNMSRRGSSTAGPSSSHGSMIAKSFKHDETGTSSDLGPVSVRADLTAPFVSRTAMLSFRVTEDDTSTVFPVDVEAAVLFVDLSGYSRITSAIAHRGAYALNKVVNGVFSQLVDVCVSLFGGDVIKFAGDAMIVAWPATDDGITFDEAVLRAGRCAWYLQERHPSFPVEASGADALAFTHHIGMASGTVTSTVLQGWNLRHTQHNWHYVTGRPIQLVGFAVEGAKPGQIVVCEATKHMLESHGIAFVLPDGAPSATTDDGYTCNMYRVAEMPKALRQPIAAGADPAFAITPVDSAPSTARGGSDTTEQPFNHTEESGAGLSGPAFEMPFDYDFLKEGRNQQDFIHPSINRRLAADIPTANMAEMRLLGVLFIRCTASLVGVDDWFVEVLSILDDNRCGAVQIIDDDKGVHIIAAANLHVAVAEPAKAVANVCRELVARRMGATAGAAVGVAFCGVIGNQRACRWDITGACCVRACRLMQHGVAINAPVVLDATVDENLRDHSVVERLPGRISVKGSPEPIPVFRLARTTSEAISMMPPAAPFDDARVHAAAQDRLCTALAEGGHQRPVAIISGPTGSGKAFLARRIIAERLKAVVLTHTCGIDGRARQVAFTLAHWFAEHPFPTVRQRAVELLSALEHGHALRAIRAALDLVRASIHRGCRTGLIVSSSQLIDVDSLKLLAHIASARATPGSGRFTVVICVVPQHRKLSPAMIKARLKAVPPSGLTTVTLSRLPKDEATCLIESRLGWTCGRPLRKVIQALSMSLPVCIDHTIQMIQRQRPYITALTTDGVVSGDDAAMRRISAMPWTEISPGLCARIQHFYDDLSPRMQTVIRVVATLDSPVHAVPVRLAVDIAHRMLKRSSLPTLYEDVELMTTLMLLEASGPSRRGDVYEGHGDEFLSGALRTVRLLPQHRPSNAGGASGRSRGTPGATPVGPAPLSRSTSPVSARAKSIAGGPVSPMMGAHYTNNRSAFDNASGPGHGPRPRPMDRLAGACITFQIPALRDVIRSLIVPAEQAQIIHRAAALSSGAKTFAALDLEAGAFEEGEEGDDDDARLQAIGTFDASHPAVDALVADWLCRDSESDVKVQVGRSIGRAVEGTVDLVRTRCGGKSFDNDSEFRCTAAAAARLFDFLSSEATHHGLTATLATPIADAKNALRAICTNGGGLRGAGSSADLLAMSSTTYGQAGLDGPARQASESHPRMPMAVVHAKNIEPPVVLGPAVGALKDIGWALKDVCIAAGNRRPVPPATEDALRGAVRAAISFLGQADTTLEQWYEDNTANGGGGGHGAFESSFDGGDGSKANALAVDYTDTSASARARRLEEIRRVQGIVEYALSGGAEQAATSCADFLGWVAAVVKPRGEAFLGAFGTEADPPPDPRRAFIHDAHQRDLRQRAFLHVAAGSTVDQTGGGGGGGGGALRLTAAAVRGRGRQMAGVTEEEENSAAAADMACVQQAMLAMATMGYRAHHPRNSVSWLRNVFVYDRSATRQELAAHLYATLAFSRVDVDD
jgi:hypothetical protein